MTSASLPSWLELAAQRRSGNNNEALREQHNWQNDLKISQSLAITRQIGGSFNSARAVLIGRLWRRADQQGERFASPVPAIPNLGGQVVV